MEVTKLVPVVNCFQFFNFRDYSQGGAVAAPPRRSCELLSVL